jgi:hypothetical protein
LICFFFSLWEEEEGGDLKDGVSQVMVVKVKVSSLRQLKRNRLDGGWRLPIEARVKAGVREP